MSEGCEVMATERFLLTANRGDIKEDYEFIERPHGALPDTVTFGHFVVTTERADDSAFYDVASRKVYASETGLQIFKVKKVNIMSDGHPGMLKNANGLEKECELAEYLGLEASQHMFQKAMCGKGPVDSQNGVVNHIEKTEGCMLLDIKQYRRSICVAF